MGVQEIADKIRSQVASAGFEHSVKFDTGSD
ncbi:MAG: sterol-binding protein, partial [Mesorhizobium sp.]